MSITCIAHTWQWKIAFSIFSNSHTAEKVHGTTLDDEKYDVCYSEGRLIGKNMTDGI